jgi:hypothetical protein
VGVAASSSSVVRLRAGVEVVDPVASTSYVLPITAVEYILLKVDAELDSTNKNPYVADSVVFVDSKVIAFAKAFSESIATSDTAPVFEVEKALSDSVSIAESLSTLLIFIRNFADTLSISEALAFDLAKTFAETAVALDATAREYNKLVPDGVAMNDGADTTDGLLVVITKSFTNMAFVADARTTDFAKAITDAASPTDALAQLFGKALADQFSQSDLLTIDTSLLRTDNFGVTDLLAISFTYGRYLSDSATIGDNAVLSLLKALSDSASVDDSGSLISQGYCDITYFAEDYVGESRTFT